MTPETIQAIIAALLSSGLVQGLFVLLGKKSRSPESENDLARLGNEFAAQLLEEARTERAGLRASITELEKSNDVKKETIEKLEDLLRAKTTRITELEDQQKTMVFKLQRGEPITLRDIFGHNAPELNMTITEGTP